MLTAPKATANAATRDGQVAAFSPLERRAKWGCGEVLCDPDSAGICGVWGTGDRPSRGGPQRRLRPYSTDCARLARRPLVVQLLGDPNDGIALRTVANAARRSGAHEQTVRG